MQLPILIIIILVTTMQLQLQLVQCNNYSKVTLLLTHYSHIYVLINRLQSPTALFVFRQRDPCRFVVYDTMCC